jgi:hypothetical protein
VDKFFDRTNLLVPDAYGAADTVITLDYAEGISAYYNGGSPYIPFKLVWWDAAAVPNPADDPLFEIVTVTGLTNPGGVTYELTVTRGSDGTTPSLKPVNSKLMQTLLASNLDDQIAPKVGDNFSIQGANPAVNTFKLYNETTATFHKVTIIGTGEDMSFKIYDA